jgi:hypothetical protein
MYIGLGMAIDFKGWRLKLIDIMQRKFEFDEILDNVG